MKVQITKEAKQWLTVAQMPEVRKMIAALKEDTGIKDYAEMAVVLLLGYDCGNAKILEASAEIARNSRIKDYYTDNSGNLDVWINFTAFNGYNCFIRGGAYLSDIWQLGDPDRNSELKSRMYVERYDLVK